MVCPLSCSTLVDTAASLAQQHTAHTHTHTLINFSSICFAFFLLLFACFTVEEMKAGSRDREVSVDFTHGTAAKPSDSVSG